MKQEKCICMLKKYITDNIETLLKEPRDFIRYPFIDPGSVYGGNVWDWDTYWSVYGLLSIFDDFSKEVQEKILVHSKGNVLNFLDHQLKDGYIPMMIEVADEKEPYLNRKHKEGVLMNMHKPFLCQQICLISDFIDDYNWIIEHIESIDRYIEYAYRTYYMEDKGLFVWCDDIMIGMDNDPASFGRPSFSTANIFLNSFMVQELEAYEKIQTIACRVPEKIDKTRQRRESLIDTIQEECWDRRDKFFYSVDVDIKTRQFDWFHKGLGVFWKTLPIKIRTWSGFLPMLAGFATEAQAKALVEHTLDSSTFCCNYGITTLARDEKMFHLGVSNNPSNWLGPIWLVANYVVFRGLMNYGYNEEAERVCEKSLKLLGNDLDKNGCMHEYYNPDTGEPIMNGGFINWNILALTMAKEIYKI